MNSLILRSLYKKWDICVGKLIDVCVPTANAYCACGGREAA